MSDEILDFEAAGRLPAPDDNVAIAIRTLTAGTRVLLPMGARALPHTVLEGHRFAVRPVAAGVPVLSWGLPFGRAVRSIEPGDYLCNQSMLDALRVRQTGAQLPAEPNFEDLLNPFVLDEQKFRPGVPGAMLDDGRTFLGYRRPGRRGIGTRNFVAIVGTTSRTAGYARQLAARLQPLARDFPGIDGIVPVAHTEGDGPGEPNNATEVLRALAGFIVHPNLAAVLVVDYGTEPVNNARLQAFLAAQGYPLDGVVHRFATLGGRLAPDLAEGERIVRGWLPAASAWRREPAPLSGLRVALQCGGSDAFSGVSGNPLAGALVHEVIRRGGSGNLGETDELMGAESYLVRNVRDLPTARALLATIESFRTRLEWHGVTAESNPSAGNKFRGLYNIALKSLGATHKKDPRTRLEQVIRYAEPMGGPGFYFMDSPGNDLEGIAGQVGAGCNLFLFVTGNGSITNFPFVPTLKITTTTRRHELLANEMDVNAGRYLTGEPMEALTAEYFELLLETASGRKTKGEHAGHSQVSLWRNWRQTDASQLPALAARPAPDGGPLRTAREFFPAGEAGSTAPVAPASAPLGERVALVLPTSLCASQIARLAAERLNGTGLGRAQGITRFVALPHTEGCGFGGESMHHLLHRTYRGYITHPNVAAALLLEHGCEKVPNDVMRRQLELHQLPLERFGWASVQLDGGIQSALGKIESWFEQKLATLPLAAAGGGADDFLDRGLPAFSLGLVSTGAVPALTGQTFGAVAAAVLRAGGSVLVPEGDALLAQAEFTRLVLGSTPVRPTLLYGEPVRRPGLHVVATETDHWTENLTGLAACGVQVFLSPVSGPARPGHPLVPVLQVGRRDQPDAPPADDVALLLTGDPAADTTGLLALLARTLASGNAPAGRDGLNDFQITRGLLGVST